jgi:hypothetical protein
MRGHPAFASFLALPGLEVLEPYERAASDRDRKQR